MSKMSEERYLMRSNPPLCSAACSPGIPKVSLPEFSKKSIKKQLAETNCCLACFSYFRLKGNWYFLSVSAIYSALGECFAETAMSEKRDWSKLQFHCRVCLQADWWDFVKHVAKHILNFVYNLKFKALYHTNKLTWHWTMQRRREKGQLWTMWT